MLKFSTLTLAQKRFVVAAIESNAAYKKNPQITLKECSALYDAIRATRSGSKGEKIGYPNWLFANNKIERGVYQLPIPTDAELSKYQQELDAKLNPVKKAKAKVAKLQQAKVIKTKPVKAQKVAVTATEDESDEVEISGSRLNRIIAESEPFDSDVEDFNQILRENGIEV
jgi:hypothetical protein